MEAPREPVGRLYCAAMSNRPEFRMKFRAGAGREDNDDFRLLAFDM